MKQNILIVDDDLDILNLIELYIVNFNFKAFKATNAEDALAIIANENIDLILLDVMLPDIDGFDLCRKIRDKQNIPIIFVSAKGMDQDVIHGLTIGGDDYIIKPFNSIVLLTKIKALLRRCNEYNNDCKEQKENIITFKDMTINLDTCKIKIKEQDIKLTPKEYEILILLMKNRGRVFSIEKIHDIIWGDNDCISDNAIMVHIANLRNKIESNPRNPEYIKTVWGFGYKI